MISAESLTAARLLVAAASRAGTLLPPGELRTLWPDSTGYDDHGRSDREAAARRYIKVRPEPELRKKYNEAAVAEGRKPLTEAEYTLLRAYMDNNYLAFNQPERHGGFEKWSGGKRTLTPFGSGGKTEENYRAAVATLNSALDKMPVYSGRATRLAALDAEKTAALLEQYKPGREVTERGFISATAGDRPRETKFGGLFAGQEPNIEFSIISAAGRETSQPFLSPHPYEHEVIFKSGSRFRVEGVEKTSRGYRIRMRELSPRTAADWGFRVLWPDSTGYDDHGRGPGSGGGGWPKGLTKLSGAKGSNPGGLYEDAKGQKWYVKKYANPDQAAAEQVSNAVYKAVGVDAPESVLGEGGDYASKWMPADGTLAKVGLTRERANVILDGFAADVFLDNWDTVGTGHDNILVSGKKVTRVDQGGTLMFRAQGALKPEAGLHSIGEWDSLVEQNHYYRKVFQVAGVADGNALGERAAKQIDRIVAARPKGGWKVFVDAAVPSASKKFREKAGAMLEARGAALEKKRDELRRRAAEAHPVLRALLQFGELRTLWPDSTGYDDHGRGDDKPLRPSKAVLYEAFGKLDEVSEGGETYFDDSKVMPVAPNKTAQEIVKANNPSEWSKIAPREIALEGLTSTQPNGRIETEEVEKYIKKVGGPINIFEKGGVRYIVDGHHRVAAALLRRDKTIKARVIHLDSRILEQAQFRVLWPDKYGYDDHGRGNTDAAEIKLSELRDEFGQIIPTSAIFKREIDPDYPEAFAVFDTIDRSYPGKIETVELSTLTPIQEDLDAFGIEEYLRGDKSDTEPLALRHAGKLWLMDGYHRISAALLSGKTRARIEVYDSASLKDLAFNPNQPRDQVGKWTDTGVGTITVKKKAAPATKDQIETIVAMKKAGSSYAQIQEVTGINPKQAATIFFKVNKKEKALLEQAVKAKPVPATGQITSVVDNKHYDETGQQVYYDVLTGGWFIMPGSEMKPGSVPLPKIGKVLVDPGSGKSFEEATGKEVASDPTIPGGMSYVKGGTTYAKQLKQDQATKLAADQAAIAAKVQNVGAADTTEHPAGYTWKEKTFGPNKGKYAYFDKSGTQVSSPFPKGEAAAAAKTMHQGKGPMSTFEQAQADVAKATAKAEAEAKIHNEWVESTPVAKGAGTVGDWPIDDHVDRQMGKTTPKVLKEKAATWENNLDYHERSAIQAYTGSAYSSINASLRKGQVPDSAKRISSALAKAPEPPPPDLVWRGASSPAAKKLTNSLEPGDVITLKGFQSTSIKPDFALSWGSGNVLFEIRPKAGAYVQPISSHKSEYEFILPHGRDYVVRGHKTVSISGSKRTVVQLEMQ